MPTRPWIALARVAFCTVLLAAALGGALAAPQPLIRVGSVREVLTRNPKMGVHTRLTDEVEEWKIQRTLAMVREMGAPWVVEYFPWGYMEPEKGRFQWQHADVVVEHARAQGLTVIGRIDFVPDWARPSDTTYRYLDEDHFADMAAFVYAFVARYGELRLCYQAAKAANPQVEVVAAGLAPTTAPEGDPWGMDDLVYLQRLYDAGARDSFDAVAIHAYGYTFPPDSAPAPDLVNYRRAELTYGVMVRNGDAHKPCLVTEGGWNDHPRWTRAVKPAQRIQYTLRAYELARQSWPWCRAVALWAFRYPWPARTYQDGFTFVAPDFIPRPIYNEVQRYARDGSALADGGEP